MKCKFVFDTATGLNWTVRTVDAGDKYGLNDALTHNDEVPLVEFYDARYKHTEYGQFVSRYNLDLLLVIEGGIQLDGGVDAWRISDVLMPEVIAWLKSEYPDVTPQRFVF